MNYRGTTIMRMREHEASEDSIQAFHDLMDAIDELQEVTAKVGNLTDRVVESVFFDTKGYEDTKNELSANGD